MVALDSLGFFRHTRGLDGDGNTPSLSLSEFWSCGFFLDTRCLSVSDYSWICINVRVCLNVVGKGHLGGTCPHVATSGAPHVDAQVDANTSTTTLISLPKFIHSINSLNYFHLTCLILQKYIPYYYSHTNTQQDPQISTQQHDNTYNHHPPQLHSTPPFAASLPSSKPENATTH